VLAPASRAARVVRTASGPERTERSSSTGD